MKTGDAGRPPAARGARARLRVREQAHELDDALAGWPVATLATKRALAKLDPHAGRVYLRRILEQYTMEQHQHGFTLPEILKQNYGERLAASFGFSATREGWRYWGALAHRLGWPAAHASVSSWSGRKRRQRTSTTHKEDPG